MCFKRFLTLNLSDYSAKNQNFCVENLSFLDFLYQKSEMCRFDATFA